MEVTVRRTGRRSRTQSQDFQMIRKQRMERRCKAAPPAKEEVRQTHTLCRHCMNLQYATSFCNTRLEARPVLVFLCYTNWNKIQPMEHLELNRNVRQTCLTLNYVYVQLLSSKQIIVSILLKCLQKFTCVYSIYIHR